jgi:RNA polymerase sigma-70 factor (ECF subfamily)
VKFCFHQLYQWGLAENLSEHLKESAESGIGMCVTPTLPSDSLGTRASLLARLKDWADNRSWQEFFDSYWQLIHRVALKSGLTETEAQEAVQETFLAVAKNIKNFDYGRARCSFKSWLMLIARQRIIWQLRKRLPGERSDVTRAESNSRTDTVERIPDPNGVELAEVWEEEWHKNLLSLAVERVKRQVSPRQIQIFDLYVQQGWPPRDVAKTLRINVAQVYLAKHRISILLRKEAKKLEPGEVPSAHFDKGIERRAH